MTMTIEQRQQRVMERRLKREIAYYFYCASGVLNHRAEVLESFAARNAKAGLSNGERSKLSRADTLRRVAILLANLSLPGAPDFKQLDLLAIWTRIRLKRRDADDAKEPQE